MLCPKVWNFKPPQHHNEITRWRKTTEVPPAVANHYFNHSVSVVLPCAKDLPSGIAECILEDSDYYKVEGIGIDLLVDKEFIEAFVKKGELSLLSINTRIDHDSCISLTASGHLVLSLPVETYQTLGLEGHASYFSRTRPSRYVVQVDLKEDCFTPGKRNYERVRNCFRDNLQEKFDVILSWDPPDEKLCPSSVAAWFHQRGCKVSLCRLKYSHRLEYNCKIPSLNENCDEKKFLEWLGIVSIGGDVNNDDPEAYLNTYISPPGPEGPVLYSEWTGFFSRQKLKKIYETLRKYNENQKESPWIGLHVHGFADSPVSFGLKEHSFYTDGDNNITIVFQNNGEYLVHKSLSSNNKPRNVQ